MTVRGQGQVQKRNRKERKWEKAHRRENVLQKHYLWVTAVIRVDSVKATKKNVNALYIEFENCKYSRKGNRNKTTNLLFLQHLLLTVKKENLTIKCT